jgi:hypothetical protein
MKVAKLVKVSLMVRVIVDENTTDFDVAEIALPELLRKLDDDIYESIEEIENDDECPFGTFNTDENHEECPLVTFNNENN